MTVGMEAGRGGPARIGQTILRRELVLGVMVVAYLLVSVVVYTDYPREWTEPPLTEFERQGLAVWREHNCQACHQIYGFGGFLGPDLTNRITDDTLDDEIGWILVNGSGRMPALNLSEEDQEAVLDFLRAVNRTGQSQPSPLVARREALPGGPFPRLVEAWAARSGGPLPPRVLRGVDVWKRYGCGSCHVPFTVGDNLAPDLSARRVDLSNEALGAILATGRGRMPACSLASSELEDLGATLRWIASHRARLCDLNDEMLDREKFTWSGIPWFEYR